MDRIGVYELAELAEICPGGVKQDVDLSVVSQWRIGGYADLFIQPENTEQVANLLRWFDARKIKPIVIGLTSNLLFDDEGLRVPCIQIGPRMGRVTINLTNVHAGAGIWVPALALKLMRAGLGGVEHICGIPGALGGLICMNGGSQRKGISSAMITVDSVDREGNILQRSALDCAFGYRRSIFQINNEIVTSCHMQLSRRRREDILVEMRAILAERRLKFPLKEPNCGSVFKSTPLMYAEIGPPGAVIEQLGFKGHSVGGALVSPRHANFIVNTGGATAKDVLTLTSRISNAVENATGFRMEAEVIFVHADGQMKSVSSIQ